MYFGIVLLLLYFTIFLHELGHFLAMKHNGVEVEEVGAGLPWGPRLSYIPKSGKYAGVRFSVYPLLLILGAFVKQTKQGAKDMDALGYQQKAFILGAGPLANLVAGCFLFVVNTVIYPLAFGHQNWDGSAWVSYFSKAITHPMVYVPLLAIPVLWYGRKFFCAYLAPIVSAGLAVWLILYFQKVGLTATMSNVVGPVGFYTSISQEVKDIAHAVFSVALMSTALGALNFLPIFPLDGGQLYVSILEKITPSWFMKAYKSGGLIFFVLVNVVILFGDIIGNVFR